MTIQIKATEQYFHVVLFVLTIFQNEIQDFFLSFELSILESERVNTHTRCVCVEGFITSSGFVKCTLLEFNMFRQWIRKLKLDRIHQERRRERQLEKQLWKERLAREQLLRDEELYSIVREREQKARELKERGAKRREADRRKYLKLQEIDLKRREKFEENVRRKKDVNESVREKDLATKQVEKVIEEEKVRTIFTLKIILNCSVLNFRAQVTTNQRSCTDLCRATSSVWNLSGRISDVSLY